MSRPQYSVQRRVVSQPPIRQPLPPAKLTGKQGPPVEIYYYPVKTAGGLTIGRSTGGSVMERQDMLKPDGWHDWGVYDVKTRTQIELKDARGNTTLAPVGISRWQGMGPNIPASSNCLECHEISRVRSDVELLPSFGPVEAYVVKQLKGTKP